MSINLAEQIHEGKCIHLEQQDFIAGDVVVFSERIDIDGLQTVEAYQQEHHYWLESGQLIYRDDIRHATTAELKAKRRMAEPVALFVTEAL